MMEQKEMLEAVNNEVEFNVNIPITTISELKDNEIETTPKGKVKSIIRKFEVRILDSLEKHYIRINSQVNNIHSALFSQLDKKYGGMYKILINTFLTNIESKIYNSEVSVEAVKKLLKEEFYKLHQENSYLRDAISKLLPEGSVDVSTIKDKESFELDFDKKISELRLKSHLEIEESKKDISKEGSNVESNKEVVQQETAKEETI